MKRCPICLKPPVVSLKQTGCIQLWELGCDEHFKGIVQQPTYEMVSDAWNSLQIHEMRVAA